jgi:hypothetical protein
MSSDEFFDTHTNLLQKFPPDVVFVDGLHTFEQSLKDVQNSLRFAREDGLIVIHDCNPPHTAAAQPARSENEAARMNLPGWNGEWCGDVWKTIPHLRATRDDLEVFVLDCDYGMGIVRRTSGKSSPLMELPDVRDLSYEDLEKDRTGILDLRHESYVAELLGKMSNGRRR